jgi:cell wall assembly regulator SMI1
MIRELSEKIRADHYPEAPATKEEIAAAEKRIGYRLPLDLKQFYLQSNGARLFKKLDSAFSIVPLEKIVPVSQDILGGTQPPEGTASWMTLCELPDGNYLAMDLASMKLPDTLHVIDCCHEAFGEEGRAQIIAMSFTEFLIDALKSGGKHYWVSNEFDGYGDALE